MNKLPEGVMALYKARPPFMPYQNGFGFIGVLLYRIEDDKLQCHICGEWFLRVGQHVKIHQVTSGEYKKMVQLYTQASLTGLKLSCQTAETQKRLMVGERLAKAKKFLIKARSKHKNHTNGAKGSRMAYKNRYGTCEYQIKERLEKEIARLGRIPSQRTSKEGKVLNQLLRRKFGSYHAGLKYYGYKS